MGKSQTEEYADMNVHTWKSRERRARDWCGEKDEAQKMDHWHWSSRQWVTFLATSAQMLWLVASHGCDVHISVHLSQTEQ